MHRFLAITKALSDENRVRALMFLRDGEMCVCQIIELLGLAPSTVSKHMSVLRQAGLVEARKEGRWMYYRLADDPSPCTREAIAWAESCLSRDKVVRQDARRLKAVKRTNKRELCRHYRNRPERKG